MEKELARIVGDGNVLPGEPMAAHTTFHIGGRVDYFVTPENALQLSKVRALCKEKDMPCITIGNGSNLLVADEGVEGVIISTCGQKKEENAEERKTEESLAADIATWDFMRMELAGEKVELWYQEEKLTVLETRKEKECFLVAGAGVMLAKLAGFAAKNGKTGLAFAGGIPGTLGGAVAMNAGAYGGEIRDTIVGAVLMSKAGKITYLSKEQLELSYRNSIVLKEGATCLVAVFSLEEGEKDVILSQMREYNTSRREKQPLEYASAGSTFKRPEGYFAGKLIQDAGLKGYRVGDIMVSEKHSGFVVNVGKGTAAEAMEVIHHVQETVREKFGVDLEMEVRTIGI